MILEFIKKLFGATGGASSSPKRGGWNEEEGVYYAKGSYDNAVEYNNELMCRNQQCCLHFWLLLEDPFEQLSGIVKNVDRHGKPALFLIMPDSCLRIIQAKTKAVRRRKSVNNATISYS